ncbi:nucleoside-diphosphate kinase [Verrucomicrobia bacterium LW23]|nr:nucleoside-diphosphate kinase [Verrucomicrobia bacterium LW23]
MAEELSYVIITPYTLAKARTGNVIARLLSRTALDLVAARVVAPTQDFVEAYSATLGTETDSDGRDLQGIFKNYIREKFTPDRITGKPVQFLALLLKGEDAVEKVRSVVGALSSTVRGLTIRDTYGDFLVGPDGFVRYVEPAVFCPDTAAEAEAQLAVLAKYTDGNNIHPDDAAPEGQERTLIMIKPDNWVHPSGRPGNVIEVFSRAGLTLKSIKIHGMSVAEAGEFYGPVLGFLQGKFGPEKGQEQFDSIIEFMTGVAPKDATTDEAKAAPGKAKIAVIIYEGADAVKKIRDVLGPTNPQNAPPGTIRREFGQSIMINAAHASDSPENAVREMGILKIGQNNFKALIEGFYQE